ncbi:MAG: SDR family oxidoreductase [Deltaproteobacteria bacterium]|nr:SDR family oxidoreductase [Deltaproteobacteria bacterium]
MARVLIAGCGDVGSLLGTSLAHEGHEVWGLSRNPDQISLGIRPIEADLTDPTSLKGLPAGVDFLFYTAAAGRRDEVTYRQTYVEGLRNLLEVFQRRGTTPRRAFFSSSTSVYAQAHGELVDETSPAQPQHFAGQLLLEGEALLRDSGVPSTVLRLGAIYGPGRDGLINRVREGVARYRDDEVHYTNRMHRIDCAGALRHLMGMPDPEDLYIGVDQEPVPERELLFWLAGQLGAPEPQALEPAQNEKPRSSGNKRCSGARLIKAGYRLRYPTYREGFAAQLAELKNSK